LLIGTGGGGVLEEGNGVAVGGSRGHEPLRKPKTADLDRAGSLALERPALIVVLFVRGAHPHDAQRRLRTIDVQSLGRARPGLVVDEVQPGAIRSELPEFIVLERIAERETDGVGDRSVNARDWVETLLLARTDCRQGVVRSCIGLCSLGLSLGEVCR